jgi:hypothetical protein
LENPFGKIIDVCPSSSSPSRFSQKNEVKVMDNSLHYRFLKKFKKTWETTCPSFLLGTLHSVA